MCIKSKKGIKLKKTNQLINQFQYLFSEDQGRYIVEIEKDKYQEVKDILNKSSVHYDELGHILDKDIIIDDKTKVTVDELTSSNTKWLSTFMGK